MFLSRPILLFLLLLPAAGAAESPRQRLESFLSNLHTLKARFQQQVIDTETNEVRLAHGTLYVSRPDRFRWEYEGDEGRYIVADGRTVWLVEPDLSQVSQRSQKAALAGTPAGLLAGKLDLDHDFRVEELGAREGTAWLKLTPRDERSPFEQILIGLDGEGVKRMEMADRFGQVSNLRFSHLQRNLPLPDKLFRFEPPPFYDILQQ